MPRHFAIALTLLAAAGCLPISSYHSARTLGAGESEVLVAAEVMRIRNLEVNHHILGQIEERFTYPAVSMGLRYGLTDWFDLGGRLFPGGGELGGKLQLLRSDETLGVSLALAASGGAWIWMANAGYDNLMRFVRASVLAGMRLTRELDLVAAPTLHIERANFMQLFQPRAPIVTLSGGGALSLHWRVIPRVTLVPELSFSVPIVDIVPLPIRRPNRIQLGFGLLF